MSAPSRPTLAVVGPTASGKTALALRLAHRAAAEGRAVELVSVDSMAVYRGMEVGTGVPTVAELAGTALHCTSFVDPADECSLAEFAGVARDAVAAARSRGAEVVLVGGTGLYVRSLVDRLEPPGQYPEVRAALEAEADTAALHRRLAEVDPAAAARMEPGNRRRVVRALEVVLGSGRPFSSFGPGLESYPPTDVVQVGLQVRREDLPARVRSRLSEQLGAGFLDEVAALGRAARPRSRTAAQALGYAELADHLAGRCSLDEAVEATVRRTRQLAVRQDRWFRRDPRITWFDATAPPDDLASAVESLWSAAGIPPGAPAGPAVA